MGNRIRFRQVVQGLFGFDVSSWSKQFTNRGANNRHGMSIERLEDRQVLAQVTLDFGALPFGATIGTSVVEDGFVVANTSSGPLVTTSYSSPWTAAQGQTLYNNVSGGYTRISRVDGGNFALFSIQLNSLYTGAPSTVPFTYYLSSGGTATRNEVTDGNYGTFQTFVQPVYATSRVEWQQINYVDYHQFDNIVLTIGPRATWMAPIPASALYSGLASINVGLNEGANLSSFTYADVTLTRNGVNVPLDATVTVSVVSGSLYSIQGLTSFTSIPGDYELTVNSRSIQSTNGIDGIGSLSTSWTNDAPPTVSNVSIAENALVLPGMASLQVDFSEPVNFVLGSQERPANSASQILAQNPAAPSGIYWIDPDGIEGSLPPKQVYCNMITDGGGWMLGVNSVVNSEPTSNQVAADLGSVALNIAHNRNLNQYFLGTATAEIYHDIDATNIGQGVFRGKYTADSFEQTIQGFYYLSGHSNSSLLSGVYNAPFTTNPYGSSWFWSGNSNTTIPSTSAVPSTGPLFVAAGLVVNSYRIWIRGTGTGTTSTAGGAAVASNYDLRSSGADGVFNTPDDAVVALNSVGANPSTFSLNFNGLAPGRYRLTIKDSITDGKGRALDGDSNSVPGGVFSRQFTVLSPPTDIQISNASVSENLAPGTIIGQFSSVDPDVGDTFTYQLVAGSGDVNNSSFQIDGNTLRTNSSLDFESKSTYSIRLRSTDQAGLSLEKSLVISVVDLPEMVVAPVVGDGTTQRSLVNMMAVTFDGLLTIQPNAFVVHKRGIGGGTVATNVSTTVTGTGQTVVTLTFSGAFTRGSGALVDGYYDLTIDGTKILRDGQELDVNQDGTGGDNFVLGANESDNFFALYGDTNGDGQVGIAEFGQFRSVFGKSSGDAGYSALFDYEFDGIIGVGDFGQFRSRFGKPKLVFA